MVGREVFRRTEEGQGSGAKRAKENSTDVEGFGDKWRPVRAVIVEEPVDRRGGGAEEPREVLGKGVMGFVEDGVGGKSEGDEVEIWGGGGEGERGGLEVGRGGEEGDMVAELGNTVG